MTGITDGIWRLMERIGRPLRLMEVCGTHTVAIFRHGIRGLLPEGIGLLSGPGCPVCVTSIEDVDTAISIASQGSVLATFGDMMRVPGSSSSLIEAKACGSDIRIVYSPLDALDLARQDPHRTVTFFGAGFETTSPLVAGTLLEAERLNVGNFYIYSVHKTVPPALRALLEGGEVMIDGFILPGHVSTIIGSAPYQFLAEKYAIPSVITGFDADDILSGIMMILSQIAEGRAAVEIQYKKVVKPGGNPRAVSIMNDVFVPEDVKWRGIGMIPGSGLALRGRYSHRDVRNVFDIRVQPGVEPKACSCGDVLKGVKTPPDCPLFGKGCTPERPVGACMVSTEGSCAAYYKYRAVGGKM